MNELHLNVVEDEADKVGPKLLEVVHRHRLATTEYGGEQEGTVTHPVVFCVSMTQSWSLRELLMSYLATLSVF